MNTRDLAPLCLVLLLACQTGAPGVEPEVGVAVDGQIDAKAFEPGRDYHLTLGLKLTLPEGLHFNREAPLRATVKPPKGVTIVGVSRVDGEPKLEVTFRTAKARGRIELDTRINVPLCDEKVEVCLLKHTHWAIEIGDGAVKVRAAKGGAAALRVGKVDVGEKAPTEGCVALNADGEQVHLSRFVGKRPLILLTYRAFW